MANNRKEDEDLIPCVIPENFVDTGRCLNGMFKTRNLIEGAIAAAPFAYIIMNIKGMEFSQQIVMFVLIVGGIFALFITGINGDSVTEFAIHFMSYNEKKRITRFNSRVKEEAVPGYLTKERTELPRDKILRLLDNIGKKTNAGEEAISSDIYNPINREFFEDDVGIVETPQSLKTRTELRKEKYERKLKEKEEKRLAKILEKEKKKAEKKGQKNK